MRKIPLSSYEDWHNRWKRRIENEASPQSTMRAANPRVIPRNHQIEATIAAAVQGDDQPFHRLHAALATPFVACDWLSEPPKDHEKIHATFCGT